MGKVGVKSVDSDTEVAENQHLLARRKDMKNHTCEGGKSHSCATDSGTCKIVTRPSVVTSKSNLEQPTMVVVTPVCEENELVSSGLYHFEAGQKVVLTLVVEEGELRTQSSRGEVLLRASAITWRVKERTLKGLSLSKAKAKLRYLPEEIRDGDESK